jgi:NAD(P)-dependent dehydrogenase (short-subunit alcohol dehydrogenase family)
MDLELRGKVAIVTGGSRGIGKAIAWELAREGAAVAIVARTRAPLEDTAAELREATGSPILPVPTDTGDRDAVLQMVDQVVAAFDSVDILVNCAAAVGSRVAFPLAGVTAEAFWGEMNVKVLGYLRCSQAVAPHMMRRGWGRIINVSGQAARHTTSVIGSTRNVSVVALTKNMADELGPHGINVTVVHPGSTLTEQYSAELDDWAAARGMSRADALAQRYASNLVRTPIEPRHIGPVVAFLASPKSLPITGDVINVAGGLPGEIYY